MDHVPPIDTLATLAKDSRTPSTSQTFNLKSSTHASQTTKSLSGDSAAEDPSVLARRLELLTLPPVPALSPSSSATQTTTKGGSQPNGDDTTSESSISSKVARRSPSTSTTSVVSSSEANDLLGPLPPARPRKVEKQNAQTTIVLSNTFPPPRIPLPSPPALGLSELLSGSPITPGNEVSYFDQHSETSSSLTRSGSTSRRPPNYSPFRSYYGDTGPSQARHYSDSRIPTVVSSPTSSLDRPTFASSRAQSDTASSASHSTNYSRRSPRVKNSDGILAPHGTFTSSRPRSSTSGSQGSSAHSSDSVQLATSRRQSKIDSLETVERRALEVAAAKGDQLAQYRLGWRGDNLSGQRYHIGSIENVWGTTPTGEPGTTRSSISSRHSSSTSASRGSTQRRNSSDLFADAANLAQKSKGQTRSSSADPQTPR